MKIAIYTPENALGLSVMLVKNLCWFALRYAREESSGEALLDAEVFTFNEAGVDAFCVSGGSIGVERAVAEIGQPDVVFLSAFWGRPPSADLQFERKLGHWANAGVPIAGFSNAPFVMASAGLLDDKVATVYPPLADEFTLKFPEVLLRSDRAITDAGGLYCANGIASGCDLIVSMIEILFGPAIARRINQEFLIGFQRGYSPSGLNFDGQKYHADHQVITAQNWIERHYKDDLSVESLSADRGMSARNFSRRFKLATGDSPGHYLQRVRIEAAKELLATSTKHIAKVAYDVGYNDSAYFARVFKKTVGCLPGDYRKRFR